MLVNVADFLDPSRNRQAVHGDGGAAADDDEGRGFELDDVPTRVLAGALEDVVPRRFRVRWRRRGRCIA